MILPFIVSILLISVYFSFLPDAQGSIYLLPGLGKQPRKRIVLAEVFNFQTMDDRP